MGIVGMAEMRRIFEVIDSLGIHREKIEVPLSPEGEGKIELRKDGIVEIVLPEDKPFEEWLDYLKNELDKLPIPREHVTYE